MSYVMDYEDIEEQMNESFIPLLFDHSRIHALVGGAGSGKSHFLAEKHLLRIAKAMDLGYVEKFMFSRKTQPAVRRSVFALTQSYINKWQWNRLCNVNKSDMTVTFQGGCQILCIGLDDPEKLKSIEGLTSAWMEETTENSEDDVTQVDLRLRGETPSYFQISMSFNPINPLHFLNKRFCENKTAKQLKEEEDAIVHHSTWRDNRFLDRAYSQRLAALKNKDITLWQIYDQGLWGILKHIIYSNYDVIAPGEWPEYFDEVIYGMDWGFNHPLALLEIGMLDKEIFEQELIYESGIEPGEIVSELDKLGIDRSAPIYADPSRPDLIKMIQKAGYNIKEANNKVKPGIDFVKMLKPKLRADSENLKSEKQTYKYKEDRDGNVLQSEEPVKAFDHLMDGERYALYTHLNPEKRSKVWFI